ncbi:HNH endonuclease [Komagataeibacter sp. FNDCR1]|nr:HNH endonuclease [Komagataeibacter sp. FNDCR1]
MKNSLTYHHLPNGTQMEIVSRKIHSKTAHGGGASILKAKNKNP